MKIMEAQLKITCGGHNVRLAGSVDRDSCYIGPGTQVEDPRTHPLAASEILGVTQIRLLKVREKGVLIGLRMLFESIDSSLVAFLNGRLMEAGTEIIVRPSRATYDLSFHDGKHVLELDLSFKMPTESDLAELLMDALPRMGVVETSGDSGDKGPLAN